MKASQNHMFKNVSSAYMAIFLEMALERLVQTGLKFSKMECYRRDWEAMLGAFEEKAAPIIKGIMHTIKPEESENIQGIDERLVWRVYWDLRSNSFGEEEENIFEILGYLNNNPPLDCVAA